MHTLIRENPYLASTPMALRRSIGMMGMLRQVAQAKVSEQMSWAESFDFCREPTWADADLLSQMQAKVAEWIELDSALHKVALQIDSCCMAHCLEPCD